MALSKRFFVMIYDQHDGVYCMSDGDDVDPRPMLFSTYDEADDAGRQNLMARACGHEVHCMGDEACTV